MANFMCNGEALTNERFLAVYPDEGFPILAQQQPREVAAWSTANAHAKPESNILDGRRNLRDPEFAEYALSFLFNLFYQHSALRLAAKKALCPIGCLLTALLGDLVGINLCEPEAVGNVRKEVLDVAVEKRCQLP